MAASPGELCWRPAKCGVICEPRCAGAKPGKGRGTMSWSCSARGFVTCAGAACCPGAPCGAPAAVAPMGPCTELPPPASASRLASNGMAGTLYAGRSPRGISGTVARPGPPPGPGRPPSCGEPAPRPRRALEPGHTAGEGSGARGKGGMAGAMRGTCRCWGCAGRETWCTGALWLGALAAGSPGRPAAACGANPELAGPACATGPFTCCS